MEPKDNLVVFPKPMLNLKEELGFTQEALLEDTKFERTVSVYDGLAENE